jgi:hypothetical protein
MYSYEYIYVHMYTYVYLNTYTNIHIHIHINSYIHIYIHIYIHTSSSDPPPHDSHILQLVHLHNNLLSGVIEAKGKSAQKE